MKIKVLRFILLFYLIGSGFAYGQSVKIEDVSKINQRNMGALYAGSEVSGYYFLQTLSRAQKGQKEFRLTIFDPDLNINATTEFVESKNLSLVEGITCESYILLKFIDFAKFRRILMMFGPEGTLLSKTTLELERKSREFPMISIYGNKQEPIAQTQMYTVPGQGFINYMPWIDKTYRISFIPLPDQGQPWEYVLNEEREGFDHLAMTNNLLLNNLVKKSSKKDKAPDFFLQGINRHSGIQQFSIQIEDQFQSEPLEAFANEKGDLFVIGLYFEPGRRSAKTSHSLGLFRYHIDPQGHLIDKKYISWTKEVAQKTKMNRKGKIDGGYLFFHDILKNNDGSFILVSEQFKRTADAAGIAFSMLSNNASMTKMVVEDLQLMTFDKDFNLQSLETIEKEKRNFDLHGSYAAYYSFDNIHSLSNRMKTAGGFDYEFSQKMPGNRLAVHFRSTIKQKGADLKYLGTAVMGQTDIELHQFPLEWRTLKVLPAKNHRFAVFRMDYKEDALHIQLHQIGTN